MIRLKEYAKELQIELTDEQIDMFKTYYEMLVEANKVMNLTAITELDEVITKHFIDSIALVRVYPDISTTHSVDDVDNNGYEDGNSNNDKKNNRISIIDLGTGAGFPGIVIKIFFPHLKVTLLDSLNKRIKFL